MSDKTLFILGGTGFIGREVVREALEGGWTVKGLTRSPQSSAALSQAGATPVQLPVEDEGWAEELAGADALIDLVQPAFPKRLTERAVARISSERQGITRSVLAVLESLPSEQRPLLFFVSGVDELQPDRQGTIDERSPLIAQPEGLARIGIPVRGLIEQSGRDATYVYFGAMVYGPGKIFRDVIVEGLKKRRTPIIGDGSNRLPLTYVTDAARALVHLAGLPRSDVAGRTFIATDGANQTQRELLEHTAQLMGAKKPLSIPAAVARLAAGSAAAGAMTLDVKAEPAALVATGFSVRYPSYREGVPELLAQLNAG